MNKQQASIVKAEVLSEATAADLQTELNTFFEASESRILLDVQFQLSADATVYSALILYTE